MIKLKVKKTKKINKNTEFETLYETTDNKWFYIKAGSEEGWTELKDNYASLNSYSFYAVGKTNVYNKPNGSVLTTLSPGTIVEKSYNQYVRVENDDEDEETWYYFKHNNEYVWVKANDVLDELDYEWYKEYSIEKDINIYDFPKGKKTNAMITKGSDVVIKYEYYYYDSTNDEGETWYYAISGNNKGWINTEENYKVEVDKETGEEKQVPVMLEKATSSEIVNKEADVVNAKKKLSKKEIIYISVLCSIILALVIIVVILLVNRKKTPEVKETKVASNANETNKVEKNQKEIKDKK